MVELTITLSAWMIPVVLLLASLVWLVIYAGSADHWDWGPIIPFVLCCAFGVWCLVDLITWLVT